MTQVHTTEGVELRDLSEGDEVLFDDRKQPLTVTRVYAGGDVEIEGPRGGTYTVMSQYHYPAYIPNIGPVTLTRVCGVQG